MCFRKKVKIVPSIEPEPIIDMNIKLHHKRSESVITGSHEYDTIMEFRRTFSSNELSGNSFYSKMHDLPVSK